MNCELKTASTRAPNPRRAFTLPEMMVSVLVGTLILMAVALFSIYGNQSFACIANYMDLDRASRAALDQMTRDIRQSIELKAYSTNQLTFKDCDTNLLTFAWNPATGTVTRTSTGTGGTTTTLLTQCDFLSFRIFQRNPIPGQFDFYPATNSSGVYTPPLCKLVDVSWRCSRTILGTKLNTESVQTAKICMRN